MSPRTMREQCYLWKAIVRQIGVCGRDCARVSSVFAIIAAYYQRDNISNATSPSPRSHGGVNGVCGSCQILSEINPYRLSIDGPPGGRRRVLRSPIDNQLDKAPVGFNIGRGVSHGNGSRRRNVNRSIKLRSRINDLSISN